MMYNATRLGAFREAFYNLLVKPTIITLTVLCFCRTGANLLIPGVSPSAWARTQQSSTETPLRLMNSILSVGSSEKYGIFSLGVTPYILSSIIVHLIISGVFEDKDKGEKSEDSGMYVRIATLFVAMVHAAMLTLSKFSPVLAFCLVDMPWVSYPLVFTTLVTGSLLLMWMGEMIASFAFSTGLSLIIFAGIVLDLPRSFLLAINHGGAHSLMVLVLSSAFMLAVIILFERSFRPVQISYPRALVSRDLPGVRSDDRVEMPIKINAAGIIPTMLASTVMSMPYNLLGKVPHSLEFVYSSRIGYSIVYSLLMMGFAYFYTYIVFDPDKVSQELQKRGAVVLGVRPGLSTKKYLDDLLKPLIFIGAVYLAFICLFFDFVGDFFDIPAPLGGTSMLILIGVASDLVSDIKTRLLNIRYADGFNIAGKR